MDLVLLDDIHPFVAAEKSEQSWIEFCFSDTIKLGSNDHGPERMNPNPFGDPLTISHSRGGTDDAVWSTTLVQTVEIYQ